MPKKAAKRKPSKYAKMFTLAREFAAEFKKFDKDFMKAENKMHGGSPADFKAFEHLERINEQVYNILRRGGLSY